MSLRGDTRSQDICVGDLLTLGLSVEVSLDSKVKTGELGVRGITPCLNDIQFNVIINLQAIHTAMRPKSLKDVEMSLNTFD